MKIKKILCFLLAAVLVIEGGEGLVSRKAEAKLKKMSEPVQVYTACQFVNLRV